MPPRTSPPLCLPKVTECIRSAQGSLLGEKALDCIENLMEMEEPQGVAEEHWTRSQGHGQWCGCCRHLGEFIMPQPHLATLSTSEKGPG